MKKIKMMVCSLLVLVLCYSFCGCSGSGAKYKVQYTDGSIHQHSIGEIVELYNREPTRDNPNNVIKDAIISGTGTVTSFSHKNDTSATTQYGKYFLEEYEIIIDDYIHFEYRTPIEDGIHLQLYVGDKINFEGTLINAHSDSNEIDIYPNGSYHVRGNDTINITLIE